jgi:dihydrofolate reductase
VAVPKLRVHNLSMSLDGFVAGRHQSVANPLGVDGERLHDWIFPADGGAGASEVDAQLAALGDDGIGSTIMGRNMFGPIRGPWGADEWRGWWGDDPPFHHPVFVLTHHAHPPIQMAGGTTFHFVTDGIDVALEEAMAAADGQDVRLGGGASTVQQYLRAGLVDELHVAVVPILLGAGERLFDGLERAPEGYECVDLVSSSTVAHVRLQHIPS